MLLRRPRVLAPLLLVLALCAGILAACGGKDDDQASAPATGAAPAAEGAKFPQNVRIALDYTANVNYLGISSAIAQGYFKAQGIEPKILPYAANTSAEQLIRAGKTDLGISYPPEVVQNRARGLHYKAVAALVNAGNTAIAVKADSRVTRPAQLSGKKFGSFGIPSDEALLAAVMKADGAPDPKIRPVLVNTAAYVALARGRVDYSIAFTGIDDITAGLQGTKLKTFPYAKYLGPAGDYPSTVFVAGDDVIAARADALRRTLKALSQGYTFAARQPARAEQQLIDQNKAALGSSRKIVEATGTATAKNFLDPKGRWGTLEDSDFAGLTKILGDGGLLKGTPPTPAELYTTSLLPPG